jgi:hypothetical protein
MKLLSVNRDAKTKKGNKFGVLTGILYLAPSDVSGYQVCPKASEGCKLACLYTAGYGIYAKVQKGRINRTLRFFRERESFLADLVEDIGRLVSAANRNGMKAAVRLNGTSDIAWEKFKVTLEGKEYANVFEAFPDVQFYCYTKIPKRQGYNIPNYHLTFSLSEKNDKDAKQLLDKGINVAVVMKLKPTDPKPSFWSGYPVIDGDISDIRFNDKKGHIVALSAKGKARYDKSGFVRSPDSNFNIATM